MGAVPGRQLGDTAHRLVVNSLQVKADRNAFNDRVYVPPSTHSVAYCPPRIPYQNNRYHGQEPIIPQHSTGYSDRGSVRSHHDHGYRQSYTSHNHNSSHSRSERTNRSVNQSREYHHRGYYQAGLQQSGVFGYPLHPQHVGRAPLPPGANFYQHVGGYSSYESYEPYGAGSYNHWGGGWAPQVNPNVGREYRHPRHSGNQSSALDRGSHRRPPITEHRR